MVKNILGKARERGVGTIYIGYPKQIRDRVSGGRKSNSMVNNFWSFKFVLDWFLVKSVEYGIKVVFVDEAYTSVTCPKCGYSSRDNRRFRGLFKCVKCSFVGNADSVGAFNIADFNGGERPLLGVEGLASLIALVWDRHRWQVKGTDNLESSPRGAGWIGVTGFGRPKAPPFIGAQRIPTFSVGSRSTFQKF